MRAYPENVFVNVRDLNEKYKVCRMRFLLKYALSAILHDELPEGPVFKKKRSIVTLVIIDLKAKNIVVVLIEIVERFAYGTFVSTEYEKKTTAIWNVCHRNGVS